MGSVLYDFLNESLLFDEKNVEEAFSSVSERELHRTLDAYREFSISKTPELMDEIDLTTGRIKVFGAEDYFDVRLLMQTAFYIDQVVLPDPIFPYSLKQSEIAQTMQKFLGYDSNHSVDRRSLAKVIRLMKSCTPMVASNYVKFFPTSYYFEPPDKVPITFSKTYFSDVLPPDLLSAYQGRVNVRSLTKTDKGYRVDNELRLGREIAINFSDDSRDNIYIYHLFEQEVKKYDSKTQIAHFETTLPDEMPAPEYFDAWVYQSINKSAQTHFQKLFREIQLSTRFGASYLTSSPFTHEILGSPTDLSAPDNALRCVINMDLPILSDISMPDLMRVRDEEGEAFELFRRELETQLRGLRLEDDPAKLAATYEDAVHELSEVQVGRVDAAIRGLRKGALAETVIAVGGLASSVATSGLSVAATLVAIAQGFRTYAEYRTNVKESPAYFLWKVKNP